jgi:formylglycine-generating enzyme required for sulfatase activity
MDLPARIGKYELQEFLGGGMSHVFRSQDTVIGRTVAVKILTPEGNADPEVKARFLHEARMAGNICHNNVISIYDFGEEAGQLFLVMEFLRGETLSSIIKHGGIDIAAQIRIAIQVAKALDYVHAQGIIHRDLKPDNIHVDAHGTAKLMDFGIAKSEGMSLTHAGYILGTPYYMAPEQVLGGEMTTLVDVYAFGILLFEVVCGRKPIAKDTVQQLFYSILNEPVDLEPLRQAHAPESLVRLIAQCTAKKAEDRPQKFSLVVAELEHILGEVDPAHRAGIVTSINASVNASPIPASTAAPAPAPVVTQSQPAVAAAKSSRIPLILGAAAIVVLAGAILAWVFLGGTRPAAKPATTEGPTTPVVTPRSIPKTIQDPAGDMVLVEGGAFLAGKEKRQESVAPFYIDRTEVSAAAYLRFAHDTGRTVPVDYAGTHPDWPVTKVTRDDAQAFARWANKRLPSGLEWEKAARGTNGNDYPWGNEADSRRANVADNADASKQLAAIDGFPSGVSPYGAFNMSGNAWELVNDEIHPSPGALKFFGRLHATADEPWSSIRGGAFNTPIAGAVAFDFGTIPTRYKDATIGFRCAREAQ